MLGANSMSLHQFVLLEVSLRLKGKICKACVQSVLVYGSETIGYEGNYTRRLERAESTMLKWICGVTLRDRKRRDRSDWILSFRKLQVEGTKSMGRGERRGTSV